MKRVLFLCCISTALGQGKLGDAKEGARTHDFAKALGILERPQAIPSSADRAQVLKIIFDESQSLATASPETITRFNTLAAKIPESERVWTYGQAVAPTRAPTVQSSGPSSSSEMVRAVVGVVAGAAAVASLEQGARVLDTRDNQIRQLSEQIAKAHQEIAELKKHAGQMQTERDQAIGQRQKQETQLLSIAEQLAKLQQDQAVFLVNKQSIETQYGAATKRVSELEQELARRESERQALQAKLAGQEQEKNELNAQIRVLKDALGAGEKERARLAAESASKNAYDSVVGKVAGLRKELTDKQEQLALLQQTVAREATQRDAQQKEADERIKVLRNEKATVQAEVTSYTTLLKELERAYSKVQGDLQKMTDAYKESNRLLAEFVQHEAKLTARIYEIEGESTYKNNTLVQLEQQLAILRKELETGKHLIARLQQELADARQAYEVLAKKDVDSAVQLYDRVQVLLPAMRYLYDAWVHYEKSLQDQVRRYTHIKDMAVYRNELVNTELPFVQSLLVRLKLQIEQLEHTKKVLQVDPAGAAPHVSIVRSIREYGTVQEQELKKREERMEQRRKAIIEPLLSGYKERIQVLTKEVSIIEKLYQEVITRDKGLNNFILQRERLFKVLLGNESKKSLEESVVRLFSVRADLVQMQAEFFALAGLSEHYIGAMRIIASIIKRYREAVEQVQDIIGIEDICNERIRIWAISLYEGYEGDIREKFEWLKKKGFACHALEKQWHEIQEKKYTGTEEELVYDRLHAGLSAYIQFGAQLYGFVAYLQSIDALLRSTLIDSKKTNKEVIAAQVNVVEFGLNDKTLIQQVDVEINKQLVFATKRVVLPIHEPVVVPKEERRSAFLSASSSIQLVKPELRRVVEAVVSVRVPESEKVLSDFVKQEQEKHSLDAWYAAIAAQNTLKILLERIQFVRGVQGIQYLTLKKELRDIENKIHTYWQQLVFIYNKGEPSYIIDAGVVFKISDELDPLNTQLGLFIEEHNKWTPWFEMLGRCDTSVYKMFNECVASIQLKNLGQLKICIEKFKEKYLEKLQRIVQDTDPKFKALTQCVMDLQKELQIPFVITALQKQWDAVKKLVANGAIEQLTKPDVLMLLKLAPELADFESYIRNIGHDRMVYYRHVLQNIISEIRFSNEKTLVSQFKGNFENESGKTTPPPEWIQ